MVSICATHSSLDVLHFSFVFFSWRAKPRCTSGVRTSMDSRTSPELILESPTDLRMSQQSLILVQRRHTDAGELLLHLSRFISAFSLVACLDWNLIELQKVKKFQQNSFEERSTRSGKLESKILQQSEMLEEFLYCTYLRQASEQRLLAELAAWQRMCAEQSCKPQARILPKTSSKSGCLSSSLVFNSLAKMMFQLMNGMKVCSWRASALLHMPLALPQARATEKLDMDSLPLKDREPLGDKCPDLFNSPFPPFPQAQEVWICTKVWPQSKMVQNSISDSIHFFIQDP